MKTIKQYIAALFLLFLFLNGLISLYIYEWDNKIEEVELSVSEFDLAVAKLKGQMRKMKEKLKRVYLSF